MELSTEGQDISVTFIVTTDINGSKVWDINATCSNCISTPPYKGTCKTQKTGSQSSDNCSTAITFSPANTTGTITISATAVNGGTTYPGSAMYNILALPIQLLSFSAKNIENFTALEWSTATELDNEVFIIEKSVDGKNYEVIGKVDGAGNSNTIINYFFVDENKSKGLAYYRLKQVDFDGTYEYSAIVSVFNDPKDPNVKVYLILHWISHMLAWVTIKKT
ncbi:MAG: hypothetical protein R2769_01560 [Saprospiraceae bacterium]